MSHELVRNETLAMETDAMERAQALAIASNEDYAAADAFSVGLLALEKMIKADFAEPKKLAKAAHQAICDQESAHLDKVQAALAIIRPKFLAWEEQKRKAAKAERERREVAARKEAEDRALEAATAAEREGDAATAEAIIAAPIKVQPVVIAPMLPKRQTKIPEAWTYRVTNPNLVPREYLCVDAIKLGGVARATKGSITVTGVEFYDKNAITK